nr:MAG TPA: hypothetical protein [Caudoviricetes sp.]
MFLNFPSSKRPPCLQWEVKEIFYRKYDSNSKLTSSGRGKEYFFKKIRSNHGFISSGK